METRVVLLVVIVNIFMRMVDSRAAVDATGVSVPAPTFSFGETESESGGLNSDGATSWLESEFANTDCLTNPELCSDGFAVFAKVSFEQEIGTLLSLKPEEDPTSGMSIVGRNGEVLVTLESKMHRYMVSCPMVPGLEENLGVRVTAENGLDVFRNGLKIGGDHGPGRGADTREAPSGEEGRLQIEVDSHTKSFALWDEGLTDEQMSVVTRKEEPLLY